MKKHSIFQKVLVNTFKIMLIPLILVMFLLTLYVCVRQANNVRAAAQKELDAYAAALNKRIDTAIRICENIGRYGYLTDNISRQYQSYSDAFEFTHSINEYIDSFVKVEDGVDITVYVDNDTIFESKYFERVDKLKDYEGVLRRIQQEKISIAWNRGIQWDNRYGEYFLFYKELGYQTKAIIGCRVYLEDVPDNICITAKGERPEGRYVSADINGYFSADTQIDMLQICFLWIKTTAVMLIIILALAYILYKSAKKSTDYTTAEIREFINGLQPEQVADNGAGIGLDSGEAGEMQVIQQTIIHLIDKVEDATQKKHYAELEKEKIKFALLQSQVNPHFMYNSLSALKLSASMNHDDEMVSLIDHMVAYYRLVLSRGKTIVSLREELDLIRKYVTIIELSHLEQYHLEITASEEALKADVLHMLLQPFVENALGHGLSGTQTNEPKLTVACTIEGEYLLVRITDNGRGMDEEKLSVLNSLQTYDESYGIKNAYMRLQMTYGAKSTLHFTSRENEGTEVMIRFPSKLKQDF